MFQQALKLTAMLFHVDNFYEDQATALRSFFRQQNIYFSAPTGYGKSIIYQALPIVADHYYNRLVGTSIIIVISPLKALMLDQVKFLNDEIGLPAVAITSETTDDTFTAIKNGEKTNIYSSPESMLSTERWRDLLSSSIVRENCIGVVIDEAHCISQW